jgi:hypothetical protein
LAVDGDRLRADTGEQSAAIVGLDFTARVPERFFPFGSMSGVAVGPNNSIFVSDDGVNTVHRFRRPG